MDGSPANVMDADTLQNYEAAVLADEEQERRGFPKCFTVSCLPSLSTMSGTNLVRTEGNKIHDIHDSMAMSHSLCSCLKP